MPSPELVGRALELGTLDEVVRSGGAVVLSGPPGIGKSRLVLEAERSGLDRGMTVLTATGVQSETNLPFAGLHQLLHPILDKTNGLPDTQANALRAAFGEGAEAKPDVFMIGLGTLNVLDEQAGEAGLVAIAEDAQWLDQGTGAVLAFVARRLGSHRVSLVVGIRAGFASPLGDIGITEIPLAGLDDEAATALLDRVAPDLEATVRSRLLAEAAGNPLALVELPSALASEQRSGTVALPDILPMTERLERAFSARAEDLPAVTRSQLLVTALNDTGDVGEILAASATIAGEGEVAHSLELATAAGLIDLDANDVRFRHPLVRSAIAQGASAADRRAAHAALATVLGDQHDRRAWHLAASVLGTDEKIAAELESAAGRAERRGANDAAVAALERAAELSADPGVRGRRLMRASDLAFELGRRDLLHRLLERAELLDLGEVERGRVTWIKEMTAQRILGTEEIHSLVDVAERARKLGDRDLAIDLVWLVAQRCYWSAPADEARARVLEAAAGLGSIDSDLRLLATVAYAAPLERGREVLAAVRVAPADLDGDPEAARLAGTAAAVVGEFALAAPALAASATGLRARGRLGHLARVLVLEGWAASHLGDWTLAVPAAEEAGAFAAEAREPLWAAGAKVVQAQIAAWRGDIDDVDRYTAEVERVALPFRVNFLLAAVQVARGMSTLGSGSHDEAFEHLRRLFDRADPAYHPMISSLAIGDLAEAALHAGREDEARPIDPRVRKARGAGRLATAPPRHAIRPCSPRRRG